MILLVIAVAGFVFGALDQWLGTLWSTSHLGGWTDSVSLMSALWLALPFLAGWRAPDRRRAVLLGLVVTVAALCGYFVMTLSPLEGVTRSQIHLTGFVRSQLHVIVPGLLTGPLFGWLGNLWRTSRSWLSATAVVVAFCGEPLVRWLVRQPIPATQVAAAEVVTGLAVAAYFAMNRRTWRRADHATLGGPQLQEATAADEFAIATITHRHADRVRSYALLAREWHRRHG